MQQTRESVREPERRAVWREVLGYLVRLVPAALLLAFILQNRAEVTIQFLFTTVYTSVFWAILVSAVLGFILGVLAFRHRRS